MVDAYLTLDVGSDVSVWVYDRELVYHDIRPSAD